jgi:hypothetical protein
MLQVNNPNLAKRNLQIIKGYIAFNACDRDALADLFCDDVPNEHGELLPAWHKMDNGGTIRGKETILDYLMIDLAKKGARADLLGVGTQGDAAVTLDFTTGIPNEPDHVCGDRVAFDEDDRITEVWHCQAATHLHAHQEPPEAT